ncbi:hypothetical protein JMJ35_009784 [Cladonia borealis]|uniref:Uncharacterized protein n=1 Tax=Cladonia borealis TaxID=184061 RepID=A0AA39QRM5_9LECA|nr:hypothetical protein JMJ35_009784 [Cladonia borealis]
MLISNIPIFLLPFLATTQVLALSNLAKSKPTPRNLDAILVDPATSSPKPTPLLQHLDLRQAAAPAAAPAAAAPAPAAPAPAAGAPAAGVGGAGAAPAAAQPPADAGANSVTTQQITTVVGGVTKVVNTIITETSGAGATAPAVQSGSIGLGTLTGSIGVVKTSEAKSDAVIKGPRWGIREVGLVGFSGLVALSGGVLGLVLL